MNGKAIAVLLLLVACISMTIAAPLTQDNEKNMNLDAALLARREAAAKMHKRVDWGLGIIADEINREITFARENPQFMSMLLKLGGKK